MAQDVKDIQLETVHVRIFNATAHAETGEPMATEIRSDAGFQRFENTDAAIKHYAEMALVHELVGDTENAEIAATLKKVATELIRWRNPEMFQ